MVDTELVWDDYDGLEGPELVTELLDYLGRAVPTGSPEAEDWALARLPTPLRDLFVLTWLESEVAGGALHGYFWNPHGRHAPQAVEALRRIGASRLAEVLAEAVAVLERHRSSWEGSRARAGAAPPGTFSRPLGSLPGADELSKLSERLSAEMWGGEPPWGELLVRYLVRCRDELAGAGTVRSAPP